MTASARRPMCFDLRRLAADGAGERWQWTVRSHPDLAALRHGQVAGDRDKAERAARASIAIMGGTVEASPEDRCAGCGTAASSAAASLPDVP